MGRVDAASAPRDATPPGPAASDQTPERSAPHFRKDLQALRALAVAGVLVYHLAPEKLGGGYVGVDVFFVISGFLITSHLYREVRRTGRVRLGRFWSRRARRLLPASLTVSLVTTVAVLVLVPTALWSQFLGEIRAASLYVENWALAHQAVDYLASDNVSSPARHYWSLSAEEQFYLVWPVLLLLVAAFARRARRWSPGVLAAAVFGATVAASFAYSVTFTAARPGPAYFVTTTRAWEFGVGGLLALMPVAMNFVRVRVAASWAGIALIAFAMLRFSSATQFPGAMAALPVGGAALVIWSGNPSTRFTPMLVGRFRPVQWLGDASYSVYLWHWPLIALLPFALNRDLNKLDKVGIALATLVLAGATLRFIERPFRFGDFWVRRRTREILLAAAGATILVVCVGIAALYASRPPVAPRLPDIPADVPDSIPCYGAAVLDPARGPQCEDSKFDGFAVPSLDDSLVDRPVIYDPKCRSENSRVDTLVCQYGRADGAVRVALIGDSHAAQWFPALEALAVDRGWSLVTIWRAGCPWTDAVMAADEDATWCTEWNAGVREYLATHEAFDVIFTSHYEGDPKHETFTGLTQAEVIAGYVGPISRESARDTTVVVLRDTPTPGGETRSCLLNHPLDPWLCTFELSSTPSDDRQFVAAQQVEGAIALDMTDYFCLKGHCATVIGGLRVYRDSNHVTATYSESMSRVLGREFDLAEERLHAN